MWDAALLIFALLLLGGSILILLFLRYRHSPAVLWHARVVRRRSELVARKAKVLAAASTPAIAQLGQELFTRFLRTIPVSALSTQPGIGPATVDKLQTAGWQTLPDVRSNALDTLPGLGPAKAAEVRAAMKKVMADARGRFDAGACPEGVEFRKRSAELAATERAKDDDRQRQVVAIDEAIAKLDRLAVIAKDVSFWNSLFHQKVPGLTDAVLHAELPDVAPHSRRSEGLGVSIPRTSPLEGEVAGTAGSGGRGVSRQADPPPGSGSALTDLPRKGGGEQTASPLPPAPTEPPPAVARLRAVCRFGFLVARADGRVAKAERTALRDHLGRVFASDTIALRFIDPEMEKAENTTLDEADVTAAVQPFPQVERRELLELARRIASAAGQTSAKEQQLLARLQAALGEPVPVVAPAPAPVPPPPPAVATDPRHNPDLDAVFGAPAEAPKPPPPPTDLRHNPDLDAVFGM